MNSVWMPYEEALVRAGSFEALVPHLRARRILARCHELRTWPELEVESGPGEIPPDWWDEARIAPATGRVILKKPDIRVHIRDISSEGDRPGQLVVYPGREVCALGIELERTPVETLFPAAPESTSPKGPRRKRGAKQSAVWNPLLEHLDAMVATGEIANSAEGTFDEAKKWLEKKSRSLSDDALRRGIKRNRPQWFKA